MISTFNVTSSLEGVEVPAIIPSYVKMIAILSPLATSVAGAGSALGVVIVILRPPFLVPSVSIS